MYDIVMSFVRKIMGRCITKMPVAIYLIVKKIKIVRKVSRLLLLRGPLHCMVWIITKPKAMV